eukprot:SM000020S06028  [mRNA]  locus=s20:527508:528393:+ [translate_table: standard]
MHLRGHTTATSLQVLRAPAGLHGIQGPKSLVPWGRLCGSLAGPPRQAVPGLPPAERHRDHAPAKRPVPHDARREQRLTLGPAPAVPPGGCEQKLEERGEQDAVREQASRAPQRVMPQAKHIAGSQPARGRRLRMDKPNLSSASARPHLDVSALGTCSLKRLLDCLDAPASVAAIWQHPQYGQVLAVLAFRFSHLHPGLNPAR